MALRDIVLMGEDPVLRTEAQEVEAFDDELRALVRDMWETMYHADGIGLAAPQVGVSRRVLVVDLERDVHAAVAVDPDGKEVSIEADELFARALQHEIDHLDGILFPDRISALKRRMLMKKWKKQLREWAEEEQ